MNTIEAIIAQCCTKIGGFTAAVMIFDDKDKLLKTKYSYNLPKSWAELTNTLDTSTDNGTAFTEQRTVIRNHLGLSTLRNTKPDHAIESVIVVPITKDETMLGTLVVLGDSPGASWDGSEEGVMRDAAKAIADTLIN